MDVATTSTAGWPAATVADLNGFRLSYRDISDPPAGDPAAVTPTRTRPVLLLLHGGGPGASAWSNFRQNVNRLAPHFRLLLVDQPGFGGSDKPVHDRPQHELTAEKLLALLDLLEIDVVVPVGNSIGGAAALELTLQAPDRVSQLVLMAPAGGSLPITSQPSQEGRLMFKFYAGEGASLQRMRDLFRAMAYDSRTIADEIVLERYESAIEPAAAAYSQRLFGNWHRLGPTHWQRLAHITHDTLLIWGREDRVVPLDASLHMLHQMPNARLVVFPHCGHWCQLEVARAFEDQIVSFVAAGEAE